jgi:hypothetical protein
LIKHPQKWAYDVIIPLLFTIAATTLYWYLPLPPRLLGVGGLVTAFTALLQILTGFYIASLAAVATFSAPGMNEFMKGDPPKLYVWRSPDNPDGKLTRRQFLSYLFGYLALLSIVLYFAGAVAADIEANLRAMTPSFAYPAVKSVVSWFYLFASFNLLSTTFLGLYYMTERIHRP